MSFVGRNNSKISARPSGGGCKLQGITSTTDRRASAIRAVQDRAWGNQNRHIIFCLNQLGGVGRNKSQFHTPADGVKECNNGDWEFFPNGISIPDGKYLRKIYGGNFTPDETMATIKNNILRYHCPSNVDAGGCLDAHHFNDGQLGSGEAGVLKPTCRSYINMPDAWGLEINDVVGRIGQETKFFATYTSNNGTVSYTHLRAPETLR